MAKNPANRYQSAADMRTDLVRVLGGQRPSAPTVMNDEDRTTILGSMDSRESQFRSGDTDRPAEQPPAQRGEDNTSKRRGLRIAVIALAAIVVVGIITAFLLSLGGDSSPERVAIPTVANLTTAEATSALADLGLRVQTREKPDPTIAAGRVIASQPPAGTQVDLPSTVDLDISTGPEQVQVPALAGKTAQQATQALSAIGLELDSSVARAASTPENLDKVVEQNPSTGVGITVGSAVKITLGSGPSQIRVPDVTSQQVDVARLNIEAAGFKVQIENIDSGQTIGQVVSTSPAGGSNATEGETVTLRVSNGDKIPMPDLVGMTPAQALSTLEAAGWTGTSANITSTPQSQLDPTLVGRIVNQAEPAGSEITKSQSLNVKVGTLGIPPR
ncbi:MAG: PASTA domain-containing protein, partial [Rhodococcus sp. (in: high G+C Gram-positive bacteria)]